MNEQITSAAELDALPQLQIMVLEVLAARYRLGEVLWTFTAHTSTVRAIRALEAAGLVTSMGGIVPRTIRASLTPSGVASATSPTYRVPDQPQRVQPSREDVVAALKGVWFNLSDEFLGRFADAALALFAQQPTVAEVKAEALREAAREFRYRLPDGTGNGRAYNSWRVGQMLDQRADILAPQPHEADSIEREARS